MKEITMNAIKVLLVEDNPGDMRLIREYLRDSLDVNFELLHEDSLSSSLSRVHSERVDIVLIDLMLPDSQGIETFLKFQKSNPDLPVIVLSGLNDENTALKSVQEGAQDYLVKDRIDGRLLKRALRYAIERKKAQSALKESEEKFRLVMETIEDVFFMTTKDHVGFIYASPGFEKVWGLPVKKLLENSDSLVDSVHPEDRSKLLSKLASPPGISWTCQYRIVTPNNNTKWIQDRRFPVFDSNGEIKVIVGTARDITVQKQHEAALIESERRYRRLSITDNLTGLFNSRHFFDQIKAEIQRTHRYNRPLSLLMLDIDSFKQYNDKYGHMEGDQALSRVARVISNGVRQSDMAFRYGGEEFSVLLPETPEKDASKVAERIRENVENETFWPWVEQPVNITISIGVAELDPDESYEEFIKHADDNLFRAKKLGKNRVVGDL